jgi:DNA primase
MERYEKRDDKLDIWRSEGISDASLNRFQVCYDSFSDRLVYPIRDYDGNIVNVGGRALDPLWKEKGLRKYTYFKQWGELNVIYGLAENLKNIKEKGEIILFEGCKSVLLADTWGIGNTGAILTSHLNPTQMKLLARLACRVVFALDKDVAVREDHNINRLKQFVRVEYIWDKENLLNDKDAPVDKGIGVWNKLYQGRLLLR